MADNILIVDDDPVQRRLLEAMLVKLGYNVELAEGGEQAISMLAKSRGRKINLVMLDLVMPDLDGFGVLEKLRKLKLAYPVIVQTARGGIETVVRAMRLGAHDFVVKPASPERIRVSVENALSLKAIKSEISRLQKTSNGELTFDDLIISSSSMRAVAKMGKKAARSNIPVLIEGPSGVGKEMVARAIQGSSDRAKKPFITVNCGALPENLIESVLFGHEKGSFTGAHERHIGKFQEANGGTLFLDEVGELPPHVQVKLLRALQEGEVDPIGAKKPVKSDFRLISATNKTLLEETRSGNFREDLYYRLSVFPILVPSLNERREEIPDLARHFLARFSMEEGRSHIKSIAADALKLLVSHDWPGNIRQLENTIFRAVILCEGNMLTLDDFPQIAIHHPRENTSPVQPGTMTMTSDTDGKTHQSLAGMRSTPLLSDNGEIKELEDIEGEVIRFAIELYNGKLSQVAKRLGIGRSTLYRRLKELGIDSENSQLTG